MRLRASIVLASVVASACAASRPGGPAAPAPPTAATLAIMTAKDRERLASVARERLGDDARDGYRIGPDDLLEIRIPDLFEHGGARDAASSTGMALPTVAGTPSSERGVRVTAHGDVALPWLGTLHVEGLTTTELERDLARRLVAADLLRQPQPSVSVLEHRSGVVAVMGSVERPGLYPITRPGATISDLIWAAGGPSKDAGRVVAFAPGPTAEPIRIDLELLIAPAAEVDLLLNPRARRGDVISLAPAGSVMVDGWVDKPGSYPVTRGLTLSGAVAAAGGARFAADAHNVTVQRNLGAGEPRVFTVDLAAVARGDAPDLPLADGDVIRLPISPARAVPWSVYEVGTKVLNVGGSVMLF